jgi:hypothetical protein
MTLACEHEHVSFKESFDGIFIVLEIKYFMNFFFWSHHWNIFWHIRVYCHVAYVNKFVIEQQFWIFVMNTSGDVGGMDVISSLEYFVNFNLHQIILS